MCVLISSAFQVVFHSVAQTAIVAYAAQWPDEVAKLAMLDVPVPGTHVWDEAIHKPDPELWHFGLHQQRDIAEMLVAGHEYAYISDFCRKRLAAPIDLMNLHKKSANRHRACPAPRPGSG